MKSKGSGRNKGFKELFLIVGLAMQNMYRYRINSIISMLVILLVAENCAAFEDALSGCDVPPKFWCSSLEVAQKCQVEKQCSHVRERLSAPVHLGVFYESLCPDSKNFIVNQLQNAYSKLSDIIFLELVPYGNAKEQQDGKLWKFTCQHGPDECYGNLMHTCALLRGNNMSVVLRFIVCTMTSEQKPQQSGPPCAKKLGIDFAVVSDCMNSTLGNTYEHDMAVLTELLHPKLTYVPWVTLSSVHTEDIQKQAENNLLRLICDTYQGPKPEACNTVVQQC